MNKRRSFLQQLGLLSAGLVVSPSLVSCNSKSEATNESAETATATGEESTGGGAGNGSPSDAIKTVGLQLYTLREVLPGDVKGGIAKVAQAGYQDVETFGYSKQNGYWGLEPKAFKELLDTNNIVSTSGHYDFNQYMTDGNTDAVNSYIEAGNIVGHNYITVPYLAEPLRKSADDYKAIAEKLNKAGEMCKDAGLKLAYHNHNFEFDQFGDTTGYEILLNETDQSLVSFEADLYWFVRAGKDPVAMFKQYPNRFVMWHVKDMDKSKPELNTEVGNGSINYNEIFNQAKQSGVDRVFVEQENFASNMDPYQSIGQSYRFVKNTLMA